MWNHSGVTTPASPHAASLLSRQHRPTGTVRWQPHMTAHPVDVLRRPHDQADEVRVRTTPSSRRTASSEPSACSSTARTSARPETTCTPGWRSPTFAHMFARTTPWRATPGGRDRRRCTLECGRRPGLPGAASAVLAHDHERSGLSGRRGGARARYPLMGWCVTGGSRSSWLSTSCSSRSSRPSSARAGRGGRARLGCSQSGVQPTPTSAGCCSRRGVICALVVDIGPRHVCPRPGTWGWPGV